MKTTIFVAGATGVVGARLVPALVARGDRVLGMTRRREQEGALLAAGAIPVVCDVFDGVRLTEAVVAARPDVIVHQLTDLSGMDPARAIEALERNARIRSLGTANLVRAALAAGTSRIVAQSIAWLYAPGGEPHDEHSPLDGPSSDSRGTSRAGVVALEDAVLRTSGIDGTVLRFGRFYGPGTGRDTAADAPALHVDDAVAATVLALDRALAGIFNVVEPNAVVSNEKARRELGWAVGMRT